MLVSRCIVRGVQMHRCGHVANVYKICSTFNALTDWSIYHLISSSGAHTWYALSDLNKILSLQWCLSSTDVLAKCLNAIGKRMGQYHK